MISIDKADAILSLVPNAQIIVRGDVVEWISPSQAPVSDAEIDAEFARLQVAFESLDYQRKRSDQYPDVRDYLDGIVKNDQAQIQAYIDACLAVKAKYPKPIA
jgi:hypothetical protein